MRPEARELLSVAGMPQETIDFVEHVSGCAVCKVAVMPAQLCAVGGPLWDAADDDDPTDPGVTP